jgi:hypothetical protein
MNISVKDINYILGTCKMTIKDMVKNINNF